MARVLEWVVGSHTPDSPCPQHDSNLGDFVMQGLNAEEAAERVTELMTRLELVDRDRRMFGYSSGMRARLALARSLLAEPPLLLLDEPTRSLDTTVSAEVLGLIRGLAGEGRSVLMASHRLNEVTAVCDRAVLLVDGRAHFDGPSGQLVTASGMLRPLVELIRNEPQ